MKIMKYEENGAIVYGCGFLCTYKNNKATNVYSHYRSCKNNPNKEEITLKKQQRKKIYK